MYIYAKKLRGTLLYEEEQRTGAVL
jgi:hypothetical protein